MQRMMEEEVSGWRREIEGGGGRMAVEEVDVG